MAWPYQEMSAILFSGCCVGELGLARAVIVRVNSRDQNTGRQAVKIAGLRSAVRDPRGSACQKAQQEIPSRENKSLHKPATLPLPPDSDSTINDWSASML